METVTIRKVEYDIIHKENGEMIRGDGRVIGSYQETISEIKLPRESKKRAVELIVQRIRNQNRSAEERCKFKKCTTLMLLIVSNV
jgi:hypothetical protein